MRTERSPIRETAPHGLPPETPHGRIRATSCVRPRSADPVDPHPQRRAARKPKLAFSPARFSHRLRLWSLERWRQQPRNEAETDLTFGSLALSALRAQLLVPEVPDGHIY